MDRVDRVEVDRVRSVGVTYIDEESGLPIFLYVQRDADFHGLEAELNSAVAEVGPGEIDVRVFTDYTVGRLANGEHVPRMPPLVVTRSPDLI